MSGLDDLIGGLTKKSGSGGGGIEDLLGGLLGGGGSSSGGSGGGGMGAQSGGMNMGALIGALAPMIIGMLKSGGLQKMVDGFQQKGMGAQADSWVSAEGNAPVSGSDMKVGLGEDEVRQFAQEAGIPEDQAADVLAAVVPQVVNGLTPGGHIPDDDELEALLRQLQTA
jgi:uncharacterized protein YidB (DUF937 family)